MMTGIEAVGRHLSDEVVARVNQALGRLERQRVDPEILAAARYIASEAYSAGWFISPESDPKSVNPFGEPDGMDHVRFTRGIAR